VNVVEQPVYLWAFIAVPLVYVGWRYLDFIRQSRLNRFVDASQWRRLAGTVWHKARLWRIRLVLLSIALCVVAMAGPQYGTEVMEVERMGADIVVALDISRSMLAEDFRPTRLDEAKRAVQSLLAGLKGDRVALVSFAGAATIMCPLTSDYSATELFLALAKPGYIPQPGTNIGDALELSARLLQKSENRDKAVILITDGEDHAGKIDPQIAALAAVGAKVYAVGIGSAEGTLIPEYDANGIVKGYKKDAAGDLVQTRLEAATLQSIAEKTGGQFFQADASGRSVEDVLVEIGALQKGAYAEQAMYRYKNRYTWPLAGALVALLGFMTLWERRGDPRI
jgi:Ca-activated chloride channel family protein